MDKVTVSDIAWKNKIKTNTPPAMISSQVNRLAIILCGYEFIPHSVSYHGGGDRFWHAVPVCAYLLDTEEGFVVVEGGLDERKLRDPDKRKRYFPQPDGFPTPLVAPQHELLPQLAAMGATADTVSHLIQTHLHADHTGRSSAFTRATVHLQAEEWAYARQLQPKDGFITEEFAEIPKDRLRLHRGDVELMTGLKLVSTPGHTPGHQSVDVTLTDGRRFLLVGDVVDDRRNMREDILPGGMTDPAAARQSMELVRKIMAEGAVGIFLHDAAQVQELPLGPQWL